VRRWVIVLGLALVFGCAACTSRTEANAGGSAALGRGHEVYAEKCSSCQGIDLRGTERGPSHLSIVYEPDHHSDESFRRAILDGVPQHHWTFGAMPAIGGVRDADVTAVIAYVRAVQERESFDS